MKILIPIVFLIINPAIRSHLIIKDLSETGIEFQLSRLFMFLFCSNLRIVVESRSEPPDFKVSTSDFAVDDSQMLIGNISLDDDFQT